MELHRVAADACEALGDATAALGRLRQAHALYEQLVGRSARRGWCRCRPATSSRRRSANATWRSTRAARPRTTGAAWPSSTPRLHAQIAQTEHAARAAAGAGAARSADRPAQPALSVRDRTGPAGTGAAPGHAAVRGADRPGPLQAAQRHLRPPGRRPGAAAFRRAADEHAAPQRLLSAAMAARNSSPSCPTSAPMAPRPCCERLLEAFQAQREDDRTRRLPHGPFSAGIARFPRHGHTLEQLLSRADRRSTRPRTTAARASSRRRTRASAP